MAEIDVLWDFQRKMKFSDPQLADFLEVHRSAIGKWRRNEAHPSRKNFAIFEALIQKALREKGEENTTRVEDSSPVKYSRNQGEDKLIPYFDVIAVGGAGMLADQQPIDSPAAMINPGTALRRATGSMRIYGHSMFPKYPAGSIVAYKDADKDLIIWGEDYVIELEDRRILKRIEKNAEKDKVLAVSYNKSEEYAYAPIEIPITKIKRLFMVLGKVELEASI